MKKVLISAMLLLLFLAGCASGGNSNDTSSDTPNANQPDNTAVSTEPSTAPSSEPEAVTETASNSNGGLTRGIWSDSTYTSEYAGITFAMPENWISATDEQIASAMSISADIMSDAGVEVSEEMLQLQAIYDMMASDTLTGTSVLVMYENLAVVVGGTSYTERQYLEEVSKQLNTASMGSAYDDITEETLCGNKYTVMKVELEVQDISATQYYYVRKVDKYMLGVIISVMNGDEDTAAQVLSYFA